VQFLLQRFYKRKAIAKPNLLYYWWRHIGNAGRTRSARSAPKIYSDANQIAQEITRQGIVVGSSAQFLSVEGQQALAEAAKGVLERSGKSQVQNIVAGGASDDKKSYLVRLVSSEEEHSLNSPLLKLALDDKLLEIVSEYLGLWPRLHSIGAWVNFPTKDKAVKSQLWHRDPEDVKLVKVFIYLVDVDEKCGPFSYIKKSHPFSEGAAKVPEHKDVKRITDEEMQVAFPTKLWMACTGPANTMILADTVGYHRGGKPLEGVRVLITFTYTSGLPFEERELNIKGQPAGVNDIQRAALN